MSYENYFADYKTPRSIRRRKKPRRYAGAGMNPELMALKTAIMNPFSLTHAGVPDGRHWLSNKAKMQCVFEIDSSTAQRFDWSKSPVDPATRTSKFGTYTPNGAYDMLFFPGLNNMILLQVKAGTQHNPFYAYPDNAGYNPDNTDATPAGEIGDGAQGYARHLVASVPYPFYSYDQFKTKTPVEYKTSFPAGSATNSEDGVGFQYKQVMGYSEFVHQPAKETRIEKWRLISCGLRMSCTNNATDNTGWWEACRVNIADKSQDWGVMPLPCGQTAQRQVTNIANPDTTQLAEYKTWAENTSHYICARPDLSQKRRNPNNDDATGTSTSPYNSTLPGVDDKSDMSNNATYCSGKLRDLHKHVFKLRPSGDEHRYKEIPEVLKRSDYRDNWPFNDKRATNNTGDEGSLVDDLFDAIHIRIHPGDNTKLMCHVVANQELVYNENSNFARQAEKSAITSPEYQIADVYNKGIPVNATTQPSGVMTRSKYYY
jgi:hypothetical protein